MRKFSKFLSIMLILVMLVPAIVDASKLTENGPGIELGETHIENEIVLEAAEEDKQEAVIVEQEEAEVEIKAEEKVEVTESSKALAEEIDENEILINKEIALLNINQEIKRINGNDRVETSIKVSNEAYPNGAATVFLAGYDGQADALTATFIAGAIDAPLLLTYKNKLDAKVLNQLKKLGTKNVIILGGEKVVFNNVKERLDKEGFTTTRINGQTRVETATKIVLDYYNKLDAELGIKQTVKEVFVVEYNSLADALAIGSVSAKERIPVLLIKKDEVPTEVKQFIKDRKVKKVNIVGGTNAISKKAEEELGKDNIKTERIAGENREETSIKIYEEYFENMSGASIAQGVVVANGFKYTDALVGGYFAAKNNAPILLTSTVRVNEATLECIKRINTNPYVLGGTTIISDIMFNAIKNGENLPKPAPKPEPPVVKPEPKPEPPVVKPEPKPEPPVVKPEPKPEPPVVTPEPKPEPPVVTPEPKPEPPVVTPTKKPIVCLDYGHGGSDPGAGYKGRQEKTDTIKMGKLVAADLRRHGVTVDETRKGDEYVSLEDRVKFANKKSYDYFVSFHRNAFSPEKAHGVETWTSNPASIKSTRLANSIQKNLVGVGFLNRGVKERNFYVVRWTKSPAVLIELGFIDHTIDNILYDTKQVQIVKATTSAILGELGISYKNK